MTEIITKEKTIEERLAETKEIPNVDFNPREIHEIEVYQEEDAFGGIYFINGRQYGVVINGNEIKPGKRRKVVFTGQDKLSRDILPYTKIT